MTTHPLTAHRLTTHRLPAALGPADPAAAPTRRRSDPAGHRASQSTLRSGIAAPPATLAERRDNCALTANPTPRIQRNGACQRAGYRRDR